ncbi:MAG TPA: hypothetical protein VFR23_17795 [Jiangellaceae bacterium]|nr:hypothetical protein [Jiangellaceae bacterium]
MSETSGGTPLAAALAALVEELRLLRGDVQVEAARRQKVSRITAVFIALLLVICGAVLVVGFQNHQLGKQNRNIGDQIADCTTAGGKCYEEGRRRSANNLDILILSGVYAQTCRDTRGVDTDAEVVACVKRKLSTGR